MSSSCMTPFIKQEEGASIPFPCGKCPPCLARRASGWSFRLMKEQDRSFSCHFVTLTYNTDHVPITPNGFMTLKKADCQNFFKRLRKIHYATEKKEGNRYRSPVRYYLCGEYGTKTRRPHYHIILYNSCPEFIDQAWRLDDKPIGNVHYGYDTSRSAVGYTLKYMQKTPTIPSHRNDDRVKEFSLMSKGLGSNYLTKNMERWHKDDLTNRMYTPLPDGKKIALPRYYRLKLYDEVERDKIFSAISERYQLQFQEQLAEVNGDYDLLNQKRHNQATAAFRKMYKAAEQNRHTN